MSFREYIVALPRLASRNHSGDKDNAFWALKDVSFSLYKGDVLGIVGANGAGKTTILKLISKVTRPTQGKIQVNGRVSALIELGAGFHPDLTGRENILLNGVMLGLTRKQVGDKMERIIDFAELQNFIDMPVKRYSSGMYARLGFAVAAFTNPDLFLIDEVLSVGDASFQRKCFEFIRTYVASGNTAIFVSHSLYVLEQMCTKLFWLENGGIVEQGSPARVLSAYLDSVDQKDLNRDNRVQAVENGRFAITGIKLIDKLGNPNDTFYTGDDVFIEIHYSATDLIKQPHFHIGIYSPQGYPLFLASMLIDGKTPEKIQGEGFLTCRIKSVPLLPKTYAIWGEVWGKDRVEVLYKWKQLGSFRIGTQGKIEDLYDDEKGKITRIRSDAPIIVDYDWIF